MDPINNLIKLLVVDDDEVDRLQLKRALKGAGLEYQLTECDALDSKTEALLSSPFDCIFLDYLLPGNNGLLVLKQMRDKGINTPVVIITSQGNERVAVELMKAGASDYVVKNNINGQVIGQVLRNMLKMVAVERERESALQALRVSESRLAEAQQIAKLGNWELAVDTNALFWSDEVYRLLGVEPGVFHPSVDSLLEFIAPGNRPLVHNTLKNAQKNTRFNIDVELKRKSSVKYVNIQGHAIDGDNGSAKIVGTLQDITGRKLAEEELMKARELAEQSMKTREIFLANMSHEIRTPMNAILGFTRLLYKTPLNEEQKSFLDAIHFSGENLLVIINDILDLTKIQSGKLVIDKTAFNLPELIKGIGAVMEPKAREKNLQFTYHIGSEVPTHVYGDAVRLNQVLTNLISNATKFTATGSIHVEVKANPSVDGTEFPLTISVKDTGIGIPADKQSMIFESFEQASTDTTRKFGGTGLGLSIVKALAELQGGSIELISSPGAGSTFTVRIPYAAASPPLETTSANETAVAVESLSGASILIVEDNELNYFLAKRVLGPTGCVLDVARNGSEAVAKASQTRYGLILMDIQMPGMDGFEATKLIRALPSPFCHVPIIAMTAHAFSSDVIRCISAGMNDYISKPFKPEALIAKAAEYLSKSNGSFKKTG